MKIDLRNQIITADNISEVEFYSKILEAFDHPEMMDHNIPIQTKSVLSVLYANAEWTVIYNGRIVPRISDIKSQTKHQLFIF